MRRRSPALPAPERLRRAPLTRWSLVAVVAVLGAGALVGCTATATTQRDDRPATVAVDAGVPAPTVTTDSALTTTLALVTDYGSCDDGERKVADMIAKWPVSMLATAGDNTQSTDNCVPYQQSVDDYYTPLLGGADGGRFYPVPGHKDYSNPGAGLDAYLHAFPFLATMNDDPRWYKLNAGTVNLFMLDSEVDPDASAAQKAWLQQQLTRAHQDEPGYWNIVVLHRPPFTSASDPNTAMRPASGWDYKAWGANAVISGHEGFWEELRVDGLTYAVAGAGGTAGVKECPGTRDPASKKCVSGAGAVLISVFTDKLTLEYRQPDGGSGKTTATATITR